MWKVTKDFEDFDGRFIPVGTVCEARQRCDFSKRRGDYFWNLISEGSVVAVTVGEPPAIYLGTPQHS